MIFLNKDKRTIIYCFVVRLKTVVDERIPLINIENQYANGLVNLEETVDYCFGRSESGQFRVIPCTKVSLCAIEQYLNSESIHVTTCRLMIQKIRNLSKR